VYPSFPAAQNAAQRLFDSVLAEHHNAGYCGNYYNEIGVHLRGLITAVTLRLDAGNGGMVMVREEVPLSEIMIDAVLVWDEGWAPQGGDQEERRLIEDGERVVPRIKLPRVAADGIGADVPVVSAASNDLEMERPLPYWPQERRASWAQTRALLFDRRDDSPFRGKDGKPYDETMCLGDMSGSRV
jgi:hypothetical protein